MEKNLPENRKTFGRRLFPKLIVVLIISLIGLFGLSMTATRPANLGVINGRMAKCPDSPNCVSTQAESESHRMEPLKFSGDVDAAIDNIKQKVRENFSRARLVVGKKGLSALRIYEPDLSFC